MSKTINAYNPVLEEAIQFATQRHAGQLRKGTNFPYITHPLETMNILNTMSADTNLLIAGVLHDTVEDTDTTLDEIRNLFGEDVAALVAAHTEDKSRSWIERKQHTINELQTAPLRVKMLIMADKVSNLRSMYTDYNLVGDELWKRFNAPKEKQAWYYSEIQNALYELENSEDTQRIYWEMAELFRNLFIPSPMNESHKSPSTN